MEIRTGSSNSNSSHHKSSSFESVQRRSNESQYDLHLAIGQNQIESLKWVGRKIRKGIGHRVKKRTLSSNNNNDLPQFRKEIRTEEIVMLSTSGYNHRPRRKAKVESQTTNEKKTQQRGPVRVRRSQEQQYNPYIEEQARSSSRNTRSRSSQQQNSQKRKGGANSNRSITLEVLVRDVNYKS
ncbi:uncharacterized protein TNCV_3180331 [Trichonephila clavipes]|uniref:Uncharacterized protein n=1 Tax=Trichonephila clavipes TaxID=2585209 RepID=A0A8X6V4E5_TRICX|nr:uncharacterized protein TNCV_3180331 [Trichonephila clavipes]